MRNRRRRLKQSPSSQKTGTAQDSSLSSDLEQERREKLHGIALDEYRFEVNLGWDRQKFFVTLNLTLAGIVPGIIKASDSSPLVRAGGTVLLLSGVAALIGVTAVWRGHYLYYRSARSQLQKAEKLLGLDKMGMALSTTSGMKEGHAVSSPKVWWKRWSENTLRLLTITNGVIFLLCLLAVYDFGLGYLAWSGQLTPKMQTQQSGGVSTANTPVSASTNEQGAVLNQSVYERHVLTQDSGPAPGPGMIDAGAVLEPGMLDAGHPSATPP